jgi:hypothetical protein
MPSSRHHWVFAAKVVLAVASFSILIGLVGATMAPSVPLSTVLRYVLVGALAMVGVMTPVVLLSLAIGQVALSKGGTDPQWFWFPSEPRGLVRLRGKPAAPEKSPGAGHG